MKIKRIIFFTLFAFFFIGSQLAIGGDSLYYEQRVRLGKESKKILIRNGLCTDDNDCVKKTLVLTGGMDSIGKSSGGVYVALYDIHELPVIKEIIGLCMDEYEENAKRMSITVEVYKEKHEDAVGLFNLFTTPYFKLYLQ